MKAKKLLCLAILLSLLTACQSISQDLPMEASINGYTIVLGQTTMQDMIDEGYEVHTTGVPDVVKEDAKYIPFYYSLDQGVGHQIYVTVCVPWSGNTDVSKEQALSATEGVIKSVTFNLGATEEAEVTYNDMDLKDYSFDYAIEEWGAKEYDGTTVTAYQAAAKRGTLYLEAENTLEEDFYSLSIQLSQKEFEKMQQE